MAINVRHSLREKNVIAHEKRELYMINDLADFPAIKKIAEALWRQDAKRHGAAIMIGAGFSRCSSKHADGAKKLPLWNDFAKRLASELDGKSHNPAANKMSGPFPLEPRLSK